MAKACHDRDRTAPPPSAKDSGGDNQQDRLVAALLLRDARAKAERAEEEGMGAFLTDSVEGPRRINARLLQGEVSQVRSHNKRCGVDTAALPPVQTSVEPHGSGVTASLEREFLRSAHQMRQSAAEDVVPPVAARKRQRIGADGLVLDIAAAQEAEARQADEDAAMANPLLRPPPGSKKAASKAALQTTGAPGPGAPCGSDEANYLWPSKGLRVRIVDESGKFVTNHLQKGVVCRRISAKLRVDVKLDKTNEVLHDVPQGCLETVVSRGCSKIEVVRGPHRGFTAQLLQRNSQCNLAVIRLMLEGEVSELELPLDDVCEFV